MRRLAAAVLLCLSAGFATANMPGLVFDAPYADSVTPRIGPEPRGVSGSVSYVDAPGGRGVLLTDGAYVTYPARGYLNKPAGTISFWIQPQWDGKDGQRRGLLADAAPTHNPAFNSLSLYKTSSPSLQFSVAGRPGHTVSATIENWTAGEWHHVAAAWDATRGVALYLDGMPAGSRQGAFTARQWPSFNVGADYDGALSADAAISSLQIFDRMLRPDQVAAIARRTPLVGADIMELTAPRSVRVGEQMTLRMRALAAESFAREHRLLITVADVPIAEVEPNPPTTAWQTGVPVELEPVTVTIPAYLQLPGGHHQVAAIVRGTATSSETPRGTAQVWLDTPARLPGAPAFELRDNRVYANRQPWLPSEPGSGFLFEGRFHTDDDEGRRVAAELCQNGAITDALRCTLVEDRAVTLDGTASAYTLSNRLNEALGAAPHVLVIDMDGDLAEPIAVEVVAVGDRILEDHYLIWAVLNPSTARRKGVSDTFIFWPKTDACEVRFKSLSGDGGAVAPAVRAIGIYRLIDYAPNWAGEQPQAKDRRTLTLMPIHTEQLYHGFGRDGSDRMNREYSLRRLFEYMRFVGFNRLAFYAAGHRMLSFYDGGLLDNAWRWDIFDDLLPIAETAGIDLVPILPSLANYSEMFTFTDPDSFQVSTSGDLVTDARGNRCPNPLRPEVREQLLWFLSELAERADGSRSVTAIGMAVDGASGTCYATPRGAATAADAGYSRHDLEAFQAGTGVRIEGGTTNPQAAHAWLLSNPQIWQAWIDFRCRRTFDLWMACRDLVAGQKRDRYLFVDARLPVPARHQDHSQNQLLNHHGYAPELFRREKNIRIAPQIGRDYSGHNTPAPYAQANTFATGDGTEVQIDCTQLGGGREMLLPLLETIQADNPYGITLRAPMDAKIGNEPALRAFARAYLGLPAVAPQAFDGEMWPEGRGVWVRRFGDRIAIINPTNKPQQVRLTLKGTLPRNTVVIDAATSMSIEIMRGRRNDRLIVNTDPYDFRTLVIRQPLPRGERSILPQTAPTP